MDKKNLLQKKISQSLNKIHVTLKEINKIRGQNLIIKRQKKVKNKIKGL